MDAEKVKQLRASLGMTQEAFARAVGVACFTVVRWENKMNSPSRLAQKKLELLMKKDDDNGNRKDGTIKMRIYIPEYQSDAIKYLANDDGVKMSEIVRRALDTYLSLRSDGTTLLIGKREEYGNSKISTD